MAQINFTDVPLAIGHMILDTHIDGHIIAEDGAIIEIVLHGYPAVTTRRHGMVPLSLESAVWHGMHDVLTRHLASAIEATERVERVPYREFRHSIRELV